MREIDFFKLDENFKPVRISPRPTYFFDDRDQNVELIDSAFYVVRGLALEEHLTRLEKLEVVHRVWRDTPIAPFFRYCNSGKKGTLDDVATCLGAKQLWERGLEGEGIVVGIVDGGVDATQFPSLIDGSRPDWGTTIEWGEHGNMCATDCLGIAPQAQLLDLRISGNSTSPGTISEAILAYDWALARHAVDGTPHILSNSWGIFQENWDPIYATDPTHPFTLLVEAAIDAGIVVLFAAGNCGETCPDKARCQDDAGPGRSIWGANGHVEVMTVGAVKLNNKRLRYSSQGPAALHPDKPDFCTYSSFEGYFDKDSGTSAACPVAAGAAALLLNHDATITQAQILQLFRDTARDIQAIGFDRNTGAGVLRLDDAFYELAPNERPERDFRDRLCDFFLWFERVCTRWGEERWRECDRWADEGRNECAQWAEETTGRCCTWWPCSWGCRAIVWISRWVCVGWHWVAEWVCKSWVWYATRVCKVWGWALTKITVGNCRCQ